MKTNLSESDQAFRDLSKVYNELKEKFVILKDYSFELQSKNRQLMIENNKLKKLMK